MKRNLSHVNHKCNIENINESDVVALQDDQSMIRSAVLLISTHARRCRDGWREAEMIGPTLIAHDVYRSYRHATFTSVREALTMFTFH